MKKMIEKFKQFRQNNEGFTLVELIVVILILAILMGVSITGYTKYIGQAKENTDKQAREQIKSVITNATAEDGVYEELKAASENTSVTIIWGAANMPTTEGDCLYIANSGENQKFPKLFTAVNKQLADGLPAPQVAGSQFKIVVTSSQDGTLTVKVTSVTGGTPGGTASSATPIALTAATP